MKKFNQRGFVLAETLVVTVFLMLIFTLLYSNFFPLIGEYEKREVYDEVDGKYSVYWLKRMIESNIYDIKGDTNREYNFNTYGYVRFQCSDLNEEDSKIVCRDLVSSLQVSGCNKNGNNCDIFVTQYRLGNGSNSAGWFKNTVKTNLKRLKENCNAAEATCKSNYVAKCKNEFSDGFQDYMVASPDFSTPSLNNAQYRVVAVFHNTHDNNNYYSYATMEVYR